MNFRSKVSELAIRLFSSENGQRFIDRIGSHLDFWRGYGAGVYVDTSGESVIFDLAGKRNEQAKEIVIIDAGANIGDFSAAAFGALAGKVTIHAFEPAREVFQRLSARFGEHDRIILNNFALGREPVERALFGFALDTGTASLVQRRLGNDETAAFQETVKVIRLSDYCASAKIERINLLKMDVEGFELEVLFGAEPLFDRGKIDLCSFEFGGCNLDSRTYLRDFFDFFQKYDMQLFRITPAATIVELPRYHEQLERFTTTNYVAVRQDMFG